jgi:fructoselysine 6-kinase
VIVASVGDNCVDHYLGAPALTLAGGNALNVAAGLSAAGLNSYYLGAVGEDANAELILDGARGAQVATDRVRRLPEPTGVTEVRLRSDGDREFVEERYGASAGYRPDADDIAFLRECRWVHCVNLADPEALIVQLDGVPVSFDFGIESSAELVAQLAPRLEIAFFSGAGLDREQAVSLGERAVAVGAALAVVTRGRRGSMALNSAVVEVPAQPVDVVDTLGAGDALIAAVIAARVRGQEIEQALAAGSAAAARACRHYGAWE